MLSVLVVTLMLCVHNGTTAAAMSINVLHALLLPSQFEFSYTLLHIQRKNIPLEIKPFDLKKSSLSLMLRLRLFTGSYI